MAWLVVDKDNVEFMFEYEPKLSEDGKYWEAETYESILIPNRDDDYSAGSHWSNRIEYGIELPNGSIKKLIGKELTFKDGPIKI